MEAARRVEAGNQLLPGRAEADGIGDLWNGEKPARESAVAAAPLGYIAIFGPVGPSLSPDFFLKKIHCLWIDPQIRQHGLSCFCASHNCMVPTYSGSSSSRKQFGLHGTMDARGPARSVRPWSSKRAPVRPLDIAFSANVSRIPNPNYSTRFSLPFLSRLWRVLRRSRRITMVRACTVIQIHQSSR